MEALRSTGPANSPTVTDAQFAVLEEELDKGPSAHGFEDERWTLARVQTVISRRLRVKLSVATVWRLLKRHGWSLASTCPQSPRAGRARGGAVEEGGVAPGKRLAAASGAWIVFETDAGRAARERLRLQAVACKECFSMSSTRFFLPPRRLDGPCRCGTTRRAGRGSACEGGEHELVRPVVHEPRDDGGDH
jgi:hypothetical protein